MSTWLGFIRMANHVVVGLRLVVVLFPSRLLVGKVGKAEAGPWCQQRQEPQAGSNSRDGTCEGLSTGIVDRLPITDRVKSFGLDPVDEKDEMRQDVVW